MDQQNFQMPPEGLLLKILKEMMHYLHLGSGAIANSARKASEPSLLLDFCKEIYPAAFIAFALVSGVIGLGKLIVWIIKLIASFFKK